MPSTSDDAFAHIDYRSRIAWPQRIARETPFLHQQLDGAPRRSVVDLGCGTGEHARALAAAGIRAVGIDRSAKQIEAARSYEGEFGEQGPQFLLGELATLSELTEERFGAAICLGNVLPALDDDELPKALHAVAARLVPGARLILQLLNYARILSGAVRYLPLNFRPPPAEEAPSGVAAGAAPPADSRPSSQREIVFLRLLTPDGDRHVIFHPTSLEIRPGEDPPVRVLDAHETRVRAWLWPQLQPLLEAAGFGMFSLFGDMTFGGYDAQKSSDLVVVAAAMG